MTVRIIDQYRVEGVSETYPRIVDVNGIRTRCLRTTDKSPRLSPR